MKLLAVIALVAASAAPARGQCVNVSKAGTQGTFTGILEKHAFPGPPNFEDVAKGDRPMETFILRLPTNICIQDNGRFADPDERFNTIHISSYDQGIPWGWLDAHLGVQVTLTGNIFASENAFHMAPLVMMLPNGWKPPE
ncbi:MAG: hypothetical protein QM773_17255 [Hyphomonadaceae bacterium]